MSKLQVQALGSAVPRFTRLFSFLDAAVEVFAEAQQKARIAHEFYPFSA